jgi:MFS transporter, DHA2 family, methylenomycin A resistance protein
VGDRLGAKRVFVAGFVLFVVASVGCALAPGLGVLIAARAVQGVGAAILVPCSLTLLNHTFTEAADRARAVGLWAAGASLALAGGPLVGGALIAALGWRAIFLINAPIGAAAIVATLRWAPETSRAVGRRTDAVGAALAIGALAVLAGATIEGGTRGFVDPAVLAGFAVAVVLMAAFLVVERRRRAPMLPLGLFSSRTFSASTAMGLLINVVFYGLIFVLSLYFQRQRGYSAIETGLAFVPATVGVFVANVTAGRLAGCFGPRRVALAGAAIMVASLAALLVIGPHSPYATLVAQLTALGFGLGLLVPVVTSALLGSVEREQSGVASGTLNTARQVGSVVGVALFGALVQGHPITGLRVVLVVSIGLSAACGVVAAGLE